MNIKTISTVILSADWYYIWEKWQLPKRPKWDKEFITNLVKNRVVLMSKNTLADVPDSIAKNCESIVIHDTNLYDINFWIWTFKKQSDMFIIIYSNENLWWGKEFKFNEINENYNLIMDINNICIYFNKKV